MSKVEIQVIGMDELLSAISRNPRQVLNEAKLFLQRGMAVYKSGINNAPWKVGGIGGGVPVASTNLRARHVTKYNGLTATIGPEGVGYAGFVHDGTGKMEKRPWLDFVKSDKDSEIVKLYNSMLEKIVGDLAK